MIKARRQYPESIQRKAKVDYEQVLSKESEIEIQWGNAIFVALLITCWF